GRNASMGALVMRSREPRDAFEASMKAEVASGDRERLEATLNTPLSDNAAIRVAALGQRFGGYWDNSLGGANLTKQDQLAGRASTRININDALTWTFRVEGTAVSGADYPNLKLDYATVSPAGL